MKLPGLPRDKQLKLLIGARAEGYDWKAKPKPKVVQGQIVAVHTSGRGTYFTLLTDRGRVEFRAVDLKLIDEEK